MTWGCHSYGEKENPSSKVSVLNNIGGGGSNPEGGVKCKEESQDAQTGSNGID